VNDQHVKAAILHETPAIREAAVDYYRSSRCDDPEILSLIAQACERFGMEQCWHMLPRDGSLPRTAATMVWLIEQFKRVRDRRDRDQREALAVAIQTSSPALLASCESALAQCSLPRESMAAINTRLAMATWTWPMAWERYVEFCRTAYEKCIVDENEPFPHDYAKLLLEAMSRHPEANQQAMALLRRQYPAGQAELMEWLMPQTVEWVGMLRLEAAIPLIIRILEREMAGDEETAVADEVATALEQIGTPAVVQAVSQAWWRVDTLQRISLASALEHIHCELSLDRALEFIKREEDLDLACGLGHAALKQYDRRAIKPVHEFCLMQDQDDPEVRGVGTQLVITATITGEHFPDYERAFAAQEQDRWGRIDDQ
jgi:hypothetical protein